MTDAELLETIKKAGAHIMNEFCYPDNWTNKPVMMPPVPKISRFIDVFPEGVKLTKRNESDQQQQREYEAEVKLFRALESLQKVTLLVLQGFKYTHEQYSLFVGPHDCTKENCKKCKGGRHMCEKKPHEDEEESDFVVIGVNFMIVIEVKCPDMSNGPEQKFRDHYKKSLVQREKTLQLIRKLWEISCPDNKILCHAFFGFTVFDNISRVQAGTFRKYKEISTEERSRIVFMGDVIEEFQTWWAENVTTLDIPSLNSTENKNNVFLTNSNIKPLCLGLWCIDSKNRPNFKECSLSNVIKDLDERLKKSQITKCPMNPSNPGIKSAPKIFTKLNSQCLTDEQKKIFTSNKKVLWINGPAGCGKTVLLLAKMIQLVEETPSKVILFKAGGDKSAKECLDTLETAGFRVKSIYNPVSRVSQRVSSCSERVVVVTMQKDYYWRHLVLEMSDLLQRHHLFIDDIQVSKSTGLITGPIYNIFHFRGNGGEMEENAHSFWVACDIAQECFTDNCRLDISSKWNPIQSLPINSIETMTANLRNTCDISNVLADIRNQIMILRGCDPGDRLLPQQFQGHFIHGPQTVVHVLRPFNRNEVKKLLQRELDKLCVSDGALQITDIGIIHCNLSEDLRPKIHEECGIEMHHVSDCASVEWPAVIVLFRGDGYTALNYLTELYTAMSRGRVYCSVLYLTHTAPLVHKTLPHRLRTSECISRYKLLLKKRLFTVVYHNK